ncbi:MAG: hypothetical protein ACK5L3_04510 [Oscillospiraceae bacterium]
MEQNITLSQEQQARELHNRIMASGQLAATAMVDFCRQLREMKESELYKALGHETFEEYAEQEAGLKSRQAYYYISTYEKLGPQMIAENAGLGITKLRLLSEIAPLDREEYLENNDVGDMTVDQLKAEVKRMADRGEQLTLDNQALLAEKNDLARQLEATQPAGEEPAPTWGVSKEEMEEATKAAVDKALAAAEKVKKSEIAAAKKEAEKNAAAKAEKDMAQKLEAEMKKAAAKAKKDAEAAAAAELAKTKAAKEAAEAQAAELLKKLEIASGAESTAFSVLFKAFGQNFAEMMEQTAALRAKGKAEEAEKLEGALKKALAALQEKL